MEVAPPVPARRWRTPLLIAVLTFAAFLPALHGDFLNWDDDTSYLFNPHYRGLGWENLRWMFSNNYGHYMPLTWMTLGLDYLLWGMNPTGYHVVSTALHALNGVLLYFLIRMLLGRARPEASPASVDLASAVGALFFSLHPLRAESVAWLTERRDVVSCAFFLGTLLAYVRMTGEPAASRGRSTWLGASALCFAAMLFSKTIGFTMPLVMLVLDVYPLRRYPGIPVAALLREKIPFLLLMGVGMVSAGLSVGKAEAFYSREAYPLLSSIAQPGSRLCFYLGKTLFPFNLSPLYRYRPELGWPQVLGWAALLGLSAILLAGRRRHPAPLAAFVCFGLLIAPTSGIVQVGPQMAADRYTYIPCLPFAALLAGAWLLLEVRVGRRLALGAAGLLLAGLGALTLRQCMIWRDSVSLWTRAIDLEPDFYFSRDRRGQAFALRHDWSGALADYDVSIRLNPAWFEPWAHRARARLLSGDRAGAIGDATRAIEMQPGDADALLTRGMALSQLGRAREAIRDFSGALASRPESVEALVHRSNEVALLGDFARARADLDLALRLDPQPPIYLRRATVRAIERDFDGTVADCTEALRLRPDFVEALVNRGMAEMELGDAPAAARDFGRALELAPPSWPQRRDVEEFLRRARSLPPRK